MYTVLQVLHVNVHVKGSRIVFHPPLREMEGMANRLSTIIVESSHNLPRVSYYTCKKISTCVIYIACYKNSIHVITCRRVLFCIITCTCILNTCTCILNTCIRK